MKKFLLKQSLVLLSVLFASVTMISCSNDSELGSVDTRAIQSITVSGVISGTNNWSGTVYLDGKVYLKDGTLNIASGTTIIGKTKSQPIDASALIITKTGVINAIGSLSSPIVFKGETDVKGSWGGLVLLGTGAINQSEAQLIEGIDESVVPAGVDATFGTSAQGMTDAQVDAINDVSSGTLKYVRVENAGAAISDANELNAFTFGAVGSGTIIEHCQAYHGADDGFEFFGGAPRCKYLISTATDDDAFDFDFGFRGKIQFAVATIDPSMSYSSDPNGIECDNEKPFNPDHTPYTHPYLSNITIVGTSNGTAVTSLKSGANFRRGTLFTLVNSILYGFPKGVYFTDEPQDQLNSSTLEYNVICSQPSGNEIVSDVNSGTFTNVNNSLVAYSAITLTSPFGNYYNSNDLKPTGGAAINGSYYQHTDSFFAQTTYKGAIDKSTRVNSWLQENWIR